MLVEKFCAIFVIILPIVTSVTILEDIYITRQLLSFFGDNYDDESDESGSNGSDDKKTASLLSQNDIKDRADHYWTRLGHRSRTSAPPYNYDYYYYGNQQNTNDNGQYFGLGKRRKREGMLTKDQQNFTSELPKPMVDFQLKKGLKKCCIDSEEGMSTGNENLQKIKTQCTHDIKKSIRKNNTDSSATDDYGGVYSLFSCDRLNRWKAMITCTINCMGEKLGMIDINGNIIVDKANDVILQNFAQQRWQEDLVGGFVDKCVQETSVSLKGVLDKFGLKCNTKMAEFAYCIWRELFNSCPTEQQNKSKQCERLRMILRKGTKDN